MAASTERQCQSGWPNLRRGLLRKVLSRLPSLADRVRLRLRAVCRPWRTRATLQPPPRRPLPWLALPGGTVLDFANKNTHRLRIPDDDGGPCYSAGDNMFFLHHNDGRCFVVNGFSGAATPLPELAALLQSHMVNPCDEKKSDKLDRKSYDNMKIKKVVMSSVASLPNHHRVVAVLASNCSKSRVFISTCRSAGEINSCLVMREKSTILDIAFFQGKMYANVHMFQELVAVDLRDGCLDKPTPPGVEPQVKAYTSWIWPPDLLPDMYLKDLFDDPKSDEKVEQYLVESNGKLLMVRRRFLRTGHNKLTCRFQVFEADLRDGPRLGQWKKARSLQGRALFVGTPCSKSFRACDVDGAQGDCIYFLVDHGNPLRHSAVYNMVNKTIMPLIPVSVWRSVKLTWDSQRFPAWFFPVEV
ncbi:uncharacterized protein [Aegilops tauschii subsp. strangulata]|nr:uncharacterized protein LOC123493622 [Aegilops tauschii subsp. strangulata]